MAELTAAACQSKYMESWRACGLTFPKAETPAGKYFCVFLRRLSMKICHKQPRLLLCFDVLWRPSFYSRCYSLKFLFPTRFSLCLMFPAVYLCNTIFSHLKLRLLIAAMKRQHVFFFSSTFWSNALWHGTNEKEKLSLDKVQRCSVLMEKLKGKEVRKSTIRRHFTLLIVRHICSQPLALSNWSYYT